MYGRASAMSAALSVALAVAIMVAGMASFIFFAAGSRTVVVFATRFFFSLLLSCGLFLCRVFAVGIPTGIRLTWGQDGYEK